MEYAVSAWELAQTVVLFAAAGGIGYASTVLLWELLAGRGRRQRDRRSLVRAVRRGTPPPEV